MRKAYLAFKYESAVGESKKLLQGQLGLTDVAANELSGVLNRIKVKGAKWSLFGAGLVIYGVYKRSLAAREIYKKSPKS